jgi:hypothetical protein
VAGFVSRRLVFAVAITAILSLCAGAALAATRLASSSPDRSDGPNYTIDIQAVFDGRGNPVLVANFSPNGALAKPRWSVCPPADPSTCTPAASDGQFLNAGPTPAGTIFEARASYKSKVYVARSATWLGTVHATSSPRLIGAAKYGARVTPQAGSWAGGWQPVPGYRPPAGGDSGGRGPSFDALSVEACRSPGVRHCVNLTAQGTTNPNAGPSPRIGAAVTGWHLYAFDEREPPDLAIAGVGYSNAAEIPVDKPGITIAHSAAAGPVTGPPSPQVSILHRWIDRRGQALVARVHCVVPCHVRLEAFGKTAAPAIQTTLTGERLLGVPRRRLSGGTVKVSLYVGDGPEVNGRTRIR